MISRYPKDLIHPSYRRSEIKSGSVAGDGAVVSGHFGTPDRYPPVTVKNEDQEAMHRAMGYLEPGETPPQAAAFAEYPLMLVHPEHVDAVPDEKFQTRDPQTGAITTSVVKGTPERFPPVTVASPEEEEAWGEKGYHRPGKFDPVAIEAAKASPHDPAHVFAEFPKMVDGAVVDPGAGPGFRRYPMMVNGQIAHDESEERALRGGVLPQAPEPPAGASVPAAEHQKTLDEVAALKARLAILEAQPSEAAGRDRRKKKAGAGESEAA